MPEYTGKYFFMSNVRTGDNVASTLDGFDTEKEAEIKFHDEVSYGLKLADITLAYYVVFNEYGVKVGNLEKIIDNIPPVENEIEEWS